MAETRVNTHTSDSQASPAVAMDDDGDFVVTWISALQDGSSNGIYAQRYTADGTPAGAEFLVNTATSNSQSNPDIAMDADGNFVITWDSASQDGSSTGIYAQVFNADGTARGTEFRVNTYTSGAQSLSGVAMDEDGDFVVVWGSSGQDGNGYGVYGQRFDAAGVVQGAEFLVNTYTSSTQGVANVAMDADGDFVVTWNSSGQDGSSNGVFAQRYTAAGAAQGGEFRVNTYTSGSQSASAVAMADNGDFVVAWTSALQDGSSNGIYAQRYNAAGEAQGGEFLVNTTTSNSQTTASVSMHGSGDFVITWAGQSDGSSYGIYAQRYSQDGSAIGGEFLVNTYTSGSQSAPDVAFSENFDGVVVWASAAQDGNGSGVYMEMYDMLTCFLGGTLIATDRGEVAVEALRAGDLVQTRFGGLRPIRWIGLQCFDGRLAGEDHQPIRFAPGSLGGGMPHRPLLVSPGHAMLVDGVLAHAAVLVNDVTIARAALGGMIAYYHLDLGAHDCVRANGAWAESYFEDHNRDSFHNSAEFHARFPDHAPMRQATCLPIVDAAHPDAARLHAVLAPRLPPEALTPDAALQLLCDGQPMAVERPGVGQWRVTLPAGARELRLRSRATRPSMAFGTADTRRLGVLVQRIAVAQDGRDSSLAPDHPGLSRGFHPAEQVDGHLCRWTDGEAVIPARLLGDPSAAMVVTLRCFLLPLNHAGAALAQDAA